MGTRRFIKPGKGFLISACRKTKTGGSPFSDSAGYAIL